LGEQVNVFIPSKGRPETMKTASCFTDPQFPVVVVEPQEEAAYKKAGWKNLLVLPKNNQGIVYVRNWILEQAIRNDLEKFWMLDDDISQFMRYEGTKGHKIKAEEALEKAAKDLIWNVPNIGQGALEYSQFSWSQKKEIVSPGYCDVAVLMFPKKLKDLRYRSELSLKEDRDFTLQVLASGMLTARAAKIGFVAPKNGSNAGGLSDEYAKSGREADASQRMIKKWPGVCSSNIKKDGRPDVKIVWKNAFNFYSKK
jgi:hypothetical protein